MKDKELGFERKKGNELRKKVHTQEEKLNRMKQAPLQQVNLGKDTQAQLKQRIKQLEADKKKLKVTINELNHKIETEKMENLNF